MKEFVVNGRKLAKVECDTPLRHCPVCYKILQGPAARGEISLRVESDYNPNIILNITKLGDTRAFKMDIMNMCMDCNVKAR